MTLERPEHRETWQSNTAYERREDSPYWDGHVAQRPNSYNHSERTHENVSRWIAYAVHQLEAQRVAEDDAETIRAATEVFEAIALLEMIIPQVEAWCVVGMYNPKGGFRAGEEISWSAHQSEAAAERWLPFWKQKFKSRIEGGDTYYVKRFTVGIREVYSDEYDPDKRDWS